MARAWKPCVGLIACVAVFLASRSTASYGGWDLVYVTHGTGTSVAAIDTATRAVVPVATPIPQPYGIAMSPDGERSYITARGDNRLYIIRTSDHQVEHAVAVGDGPYGVAISPDGLRAYVANGGENSMTVVDTTSSAVVATVPVGLLPFGVAISPDGTRVYVSVMGADAIAVVDALTNEVAAHIPVGDNPRDVVVSPDGARLYSANQFSSTVSVVDTTAGVVIATIEVGSNPHSLAQTGDGRRLYVSHNLPDGTVSVIDTATNRVVGLVTGVGAYPVGLAVDGEYGYAAVSSGYDVAVFDLETNAIVERIATGENPMSVAVLPSVVVDNPEGSYEYGAGSFTSPPGAYTADPTLAGTAYVTQLYARRAADGTLTYPANTFRFSYLPARLHFASTSMKSLVISGNRSWLRGEGICTIGFTREACEYLLAVVDSFSSPDNVRVKIWNKVSGQVVYDNQTGAPDEAEAARPTSGPGTIVFVNK